MPILLLLFSFTTLSTILVAAQSAVDHDKVLDILQDDCANCHGLYRMGGLGPALTPERLQSIPNETLKVIIREGIPGKFMPPWKAVLTDDEILYLVEYLKNTPATPPKIQIRKPVSP